ncbi:MAG: SOS response-associated peptidase [Motiliproteus sp.]|nr:SOS response-associated peptidase [Motiliproteus sp.]MCW9050719.1 SOS response-associated peptidase [Motiliproteus sp.]
MCGYIGNTTDDPLTRTLMEILGMADLLPDLQDNPGSGPASEIDIIAKGQRGTQVSTATWWLLLDAEADQGFKPSRYTSFNTRSDKLNQPSSAGYHPFRQSRCIIPASYIIEGEGPKNARRYHRIVPQHHGFALGGLYRQWTHPQSGEVKTACSVITLPPHRNWQNIHSKSTPLFLPADQPQLIQDWLDPKITDVDRFRPLLEPRFYDRLSCTPIQRPSQQTATGPSVMVDQQGIHSHSEPFRLQ